MEWLPVFVNFRRDGYDFDARWDDELVGIRHKGIMDCFGNSSGGGIVEYTGLQLKQLAGFGKGRHKNFDGIMTDLQMQTYLVIKEFRRKRNKKGQEYGMPGGNRFVQGRAPAVKGKDLRPPERAVPRCG